VKSEFGSGFGQVKLQLAFHFRLAAIATRNLASGCTSTRPKPSKNTKKFICECEKKSTDPAIRDPQGSNELGNRLCHRSISFAQFFT